MAVDMAISATEKPLGKVFTSDYQFTIPSFQRAYTWQAENIEQLVNDLQDAMSFYPKPARVYECDTRYEELAGCDVPERRCVKRR